jgi:hypothetical protein
MQKSSDAAVDRGGDVPTCILLRTKEINKSVLEFADTLEAISGHVVALLVDVRSGNSESKSHSTVALSKDACRSLGLFCPPDFAWSCGDYGYYLARRQFPQTEFFWMIESDVRFYGEDPATLFRYFSNKSEIDLLVAQLKQADDSWFWRTTTLSRDAIPFRCFFPTTRLSRRAIDASFERRIRHSRQLRRRLFWPNDEALVATTLMNGKFVCRDFNDFGMTFYTEETFHYGDPIRGECFKLPGATARMAHPVLFGSEYVAKMRALEDDRPVPLPWLTRKLRPVAYRLNLRSRW